MNYFVDWTDDARAALALLWIPAPDRDKVTAAQARIDQVLAVNPHGSSAPVSEGLFALNEHPLRVLFEIDEAVRLVTVVSVARLP